jgi:uncharacterized Ntn-hydrolase superfamily protein
MQGTFSIVGRCSAEGELGVCVSTAVPFVGRMVPHVQADVGAVATQAQTNVYYGKKGLELLRKGWSSRSALRSMLDEDDEREVRQVIMIDKHGETAAFTGKDTMSWKGHLVGKNYVAAGNLLVGGSVIEAMARTFESEKVILAERLLRSLEAGQSEGGDKRGRVSAALLVAGRRYGINPYISINVDRDQDPVKKLREEFEKFKKDAHLRLQK